MQTLYDLVFMGCNVGKYSTVLYKSQGIYDVNHRNHCGFRQCFFLRTEKNVNGIVIIQSIAIMTMYIPSSVFSPA